MSIKIRKRNMGKMTNRSALFILAVVILPVLLSGGVSAQSKNRLYELYNSTSTPEHYKRALEPVIQRHERMDKIRAKHALTAFKFGGVYALPNPAVGVKHPVIHIEAGLADKVEIKVYDSAGKLAEEAALMGPPTIIKGVYAYEYKFLSNDTPYGTCRFTVKAYKAGKEPIEAAGRMIFVKMGD
jgi:hypothetical protein